MSDSRSAVNNNNNTILQVVGPLRTDRASERNNERHIYCWFSLCFARLNTRDAAAAGYVNYEL